MNWEEEYLGSEEYFKNLNTSTIIDYMKQMEKYRILNNLKPNRIIFNGKSTICYFPEGDKVVVTCHDGEQYEKEVGVMACIMKKLYGTRAEFLRTVQKGYVQPQPQKQKEVDKSKWVEKYDPIKDD